MSGEGGAQAESSIECCQAYPPPDRQPGGAGARAVDRLRAEDQPVPQAALRGDPRRWRAQGPALPPVRLGLLLRKGSFVGLGLHANSRAVGFGMEDKRFAGDGLVAGFGTV